MASRSPLEVQQDIVPSGDVDADSLATRARDAVQRGALDSAVESARVALALDPKHQEALYVLAVAYRLAKKSAEALAALRTLIDAYPSYGRAHQERGHVLRDAERFDEALAAYQEAVAHNNALVGSWRMLAILHKRQGDENAAQHATAQCAYYDSLPPELLTVANYIQEGRLLKAETLCRAFLQKNKHHPEGMRLLADIGTRFNAYDEAEFLLESCVVLDPLNTNAHYDYVNVLHKRQKFGAALEQATALREKAPRKPQFEILLANENLAVGNFDAALELYREQLKVAPYNASLYLTLGHALKTVGRQSEAIEAYTNAFRVRPDFGDAFWSLANLKTYRFSDETVRQMKAVEAAERTALEDRYHLCFALGKALEDRGDYRASFEYYDRGNRLKREEVGYDWRKVQREIALQIEHCDAALFAQHKARGFDAADPIFIVGLPRAGSTLLEQILASHSQVEGTMELPDILALAHRLDGRRRIDEEARYPANLREIDSAEFKKFGETYIRDTMIQRKKRTPFFIDKMPNNFRHIALIHLILPDAKIIDARRGAMGCCFSGFKQLFAEGQEFTYGLEEIGHYYRDYVALMEHWDRVLPGKVLRVRYEDVVADTEAQVRRILDYCGLPFEDACLSFHQTERAVRTASSEQVRQPIFTSGLDQWAHYAPYLDPLRALLGPDLVQT